MSRVGQCPSCHTVYELDDDSLGRVMDCQCGAALFICDVAGFNEIPVGCIQCGGQYVVDSDGAGETVECDCGEHLTVPTVVLRQPVASPGASAETLLDAPQEQPVPVQAVACPGCGKQYSADRDDVGDEAECRCGCVFVIRARPDGTLACQRKRLSEAAGEGDQDADEKPQPRKRPVSLVSILGIAAVGLLLLVSIIMFATRDRQQVAAESEPKKTVKIDRAAGQPAAASGVTSSGVDSFRPPTMSPIGAAADNAADKLAGAQIPPIPDPEAGANRSASRSRGKISSLLAPPPQKPLPDTKPARPLIPIVAASQRGLTFERAYLEAFQAYEETNRLKKEAGQSGDPAAYNKQLGQTIGLLQQTLSIATRQSGNDKVDELRYLLTYLYFMAGRLPEASVLGAAVARWGDVEQAATLEAAMIALAATQEANQTGWGALDDVGELDQMAAIADIIAQRWPDNPQLDLIWMNLAQRYDAFGQSLPSADAYARVPKSSARYGEAQLAAGSALWAQYRKNIAAGAEPASQQQVALLQRAENLLSLGVETVVADLEKPTATVMAAKLSLARMALVAGDLQQAESWLVDPPLAVVDSVVVSKPTDQTVQVSEGFVRSAFETLFTVRTQRRDAVGAKAALEMLAAQVGGKVDFAKLFLGVATDYIDQLSSSRSITRAQFSTLSDLIEPLKEDAATLTVPNVLWLGESWSRLAERASSPALAKQCYAKAAAAYGLAMNRSDFPAGSKQSATIRCAELLRSAGQLTAVLPLLESILQRTPSAFGIQIQAAETLQQVAIDAGTPMQLAAAVDGPGSQADAKSPIWGWAKLVTTLHSVGGSDSDEDAHRDRLLKCQYNLAKCQWLIAKSTTDSAQRDEMLDDCRRSLDRLVATTGPQREPWYARLRELQKQAAAEK